MFFRVSGVEKYRCLQIVENRREGRRTVQHVLFTLGRLEDLQGGSIDVLLRSLARFGRNVKMVDAMKGEHVIAGEETTQSRMENFQDFPLLKDDRAARTLRNSPTLSDLSGEEICELSQLTASRYFRAGEFLYLQGDPVQYCHVLASGMIKILNHSASGRDLISAVSGPGGTLGIMGILVGDPYPSSAQAIKETEALLIKRGDFGRFLQKHEGLSLKITARLLEVARRRHQAALVRLDELTTEPTSYRIGHVLSTLCLGLGPTIPLTRLEIAEIAGTTPETVARFISCLTRAGVLQSSRGKVVVLQQDKLVQPD